jgi:DNA-binding NarL/FixJ family response regulator
MSNNVKKIGVILVDDHPAVMRQTIQLLPERFDILETLQNGTDFLRTVRDIQPDVIVLDITLPGISGVELARRLRIPEGLCKSKIVFLTVHSDPDYAREAFSVGAMGYVIKPRLASDLVPAIDAALAGKRFISPCPELAEFK